MGHGSLAQAPAINHTTLKAKGMFRGYPYNIDIFGTLSTPAAYEAIAKADCVVAFGTSLHHFTTDKGALMKGKRVVQINDTVTEVAKNYHPDAALVADAGLTADNIVWWLDEAEIPGSGFTAELDMEVLTAHPKGNPEKAKPGFAKEKDLVALGERIYRGGIAERKIAACAGCHSPNGAGIPAQYPRTSGQHADYSKTQLTAFRDGIRANSVQMTGVAARLNDREIRAVSDYMAGLR